MTIDRIVVVGAGAVGGLLAARLVQAGSAVVAVARGPHGAAMRGSGLTVESPLGSTTVRLPVVPHLDGVRWRAGDVVVLAVKAHDTPAVLADLARVWQRPLPVACAQNGIANEPTARRWTPDVYGICVMFPATHLEPGVVRAHWAPTTGMLDVGRFPRGIDPRTEDLAATFRRASFSSRAQADIMRWKHAKLVMNLGNAVEALCGRRSRGGDVARLLEREGRACLAAADFDVATDREISRRRAEMGPITADDSAAGGSTWQSLARGQAVESAYLNGEIVVLGEQHGVATPANALVLDRVLVAAAARQPRGDVTEDELMDAIGRISRAEATTTTRSAARRMPVARTRGGRHREMR
jgi:2-dehydropantoate 2-reductase